MLWFVLKKRRSRKYLSRLLRFYNYICTFTQNSLSKIHLGMVYRMIHFQALPKRQHYFTFKNRITNKSLNFSSGQILSTAGFDLKYFKRSANSTATLVLFFRHKYLLLFQNIYIYFLKNFNYRQVYFFKKLDISISLNIYYLIHRHPYVPHFFRPRRIKRRVLRLIAQQ